MKKRILTAAAVGCALILTTGLAAMAETKTVHMGDREIEVEVTDIGKQGTFTYWSAFTGDSATWEQERVDAFNEAYADLGISVDVQYVPDGASFFGRSPAEQLRIC